jgi:UDP-N-acetylmuramoyl-tripeptide--D-alanyl-D-alanine ligase
MLVKEIIEATQGTLLSGRLDDDITHFTQDSRACHEGSLYVPISGANHDGHDFIGSAFEHHASAIITQKEVNYPDKDVILVKDTLKALGDMARYVRIHSHAFVVGITGSVGKTSTKDMIFSVVSEKYKALKTLGNYNNNIGLPLTILRYHDEEAMVIEMGMNHLGEIDYLTNIALPNVAAITNVGTAHIGEVGSRDNILKAKMEITHGLSEGGTLIVNHDNDKLATVKPDGFVLKTIGIDDPADLMAKNVVLNADGSDFDVAYEGKNYHVHLAVPGKHFVYNALVAMEVGLSVDIPMEKCVHGVETFELTKNRADKLTLKDDITLFDGTYNANLDSMKASIDVLASCKGRKIAVVGDMLELGNYEEKLHREVGKYLADHNIDLTLAVGKASEYIISEVKKNGGKGEHFDNNEALLKALLEEVKPHDVLLVKASNGMHLKDVVEKLKERFS